MPLPPTFVIIGAMKGGTTSLHAYMAEHPQVCMSKRKETDYFIAAKRTAVKTEHWYRKQFRFEADAAGEASPNYTKRHLFPGVPEAIVEGCGKGVKLIYVVRDPALRAVSHYGHNVIMGREKKSPADVAAQPDSNYVKTSRYADQLAAFLPHVPLERILIVRSEELRTDTEAKLRDVFAFVGVRPDVTIPGAIEQLHVSSQKLRKSWLERHVANRKVRRAVKPYLPGPLTKRQPVEVPKASPADVDRLREHLAADAERFAALTGVTLAGMGWDPSRNPAVVTGPAPLKKAA